MDGGIEARGVAKHYGRLVALADLTFTARPEEILGLLGPNGAGKTSAIRVLTTVLPATAGSFSIGEISHTSPIEIRRIIGVLPESAGYPGWQTGEEYLRYHARLHGRSRGAAREATETLLALVDLTERARTPIAGYSRGMRQRLGIARALVNDPAVVFLDEPTLGLDPAGQRKVLDLVRLTARERGATVVLSTHRLDEVEEVCSRVLVLNRGRVLADGSVDEVARRAAAPRSARLRVPPRDVHLARRALADAAGVDRVDVTGGEPGSLSVTLDGGPGTTWMNDGLRALADAGVPVLGFELGGARLSDAFLAMTEGT